MDTNVIMDYEFDTGWVLLFITSVKDGNECYDGLRNWYRLNSIFVSICIQMLRDGYECWFRLELKDDYKCFDCYIGYECRFRMLNRMDTMIDYEFDTMLWLIIMLI